MKILRSMTLVAVALGISVAASADDYRRPGAEAQAVTPRLVAEVRAATSKFLDINVAMTAGFVPATPCVSGPNEGAMGVHFLLPSRIGQLDPKLPQILIYEPMANGQMRLVGVEYVMPVEVWSASNPPGSVPSVAGNLMNYQAAPNRYGLPDSYYLHLWAWQDNTKGAFADWNPDVSCRNQPN